jgi:SPP1 gp7 family putative phage head morphogenesis protein
MATLAMQLRSQQLIRMQSGLGRPGHRARAGRPRPPGRPLAPLAIEAAYVRDMREVAAKAKLVLQEILLPRIPQLAREAGIDTRRADAYADSLAQLMALVRATHFGLEGIPRAEELARRYAAQISVFGRQDLLRMVGRSLGIDVFLEDRLVAADLRAFVTQNARLIQSVPERYFEQVEETLLTGLRAGTRVEELQDVIEDRFAVPAARAEFIARDQVGKFYGQLNQLRQEELGIGQYTWRTVGDEKVRGTPGGRWPHGMHYDLDGKVFSWSDPPVTNSRGDRNHPGGDYECRCMAEPVIKI